MYCYERETFIPMAAMFIVLTILQVAIQPSWWQWALIVPGISGAAWLWSLAWMTGVFTRRWGQTPDEMEKE
jgi:hypothetical protein